MKYISHQTNSCNLSSHSTTLLGYYTLLYTITTGCASEWVTVQALICISLVPCIPMRTSPYLWYFCILQPISLSVLQIVIVKRLQCQHYYTWYVCILCILCLFCIPVHTYYAVLCILLHTYAYLCIAMHTTVQALAPVDC